MSSITVNFFDKWRHVDKESYVLCNNIDPCICSKKALWVHERHFRDGRVEPLTFLCEDHVDSPWSLSLQELQKKLPWTAHHHRDFRVSRMVHKDFGHALLHVTKASGKLASMVNDAEHSGCDFKEAAPYIADLVICALRMANTCPGGVIDLQKAVVDRIESKNQVKLVKKENNCEVTLRNSCNTGIYTGKS